MSDSKEENNAGKSPLRKWIFRITGIIVVLALLVGGVMGFMAWKISSDAKEVYELGSTLNKFLGNYASSVKRRNAEEILANYADEYADASAGDWGGNLFWEDTEADGTLKVFLWEEENLRAFKKDDIKGQIDELLDEMRYVSLAKFKIEAIEENDGLDSATLKTLLWLRGREEDGQLVETHAHFRLSLVNDGGWKIQRQDLIRGVTVRGDGAGFADVTEESGIEFQSVHNPMLKEEGWKPEVFEIMQYAHGGVSTGDYDGDGWQDIFFGDGVSPRLYRNQGDGTFKDVTAEVGLPMELKAAHVSVFADFDNDGDPELFIGRSTAENKLYRNDGGKFTDVTEEANLGHIFVTVAAAADYNNDGLLDLYIGRYLDPRTNLPTTLFYTRNSEGNTLLKNDGDLKFTDVTEEAGVRDGGLSLGVAWGDYDSDGLLDLYVSNDFGRNSLYHNEGDGTFTDVSVASGTIDISYGMSASFADLDNDKDLDIFVSNVHSGQRWFGNEATLKNYFMTSFKQGTLSEDKALLDEVVSLLDGDWAALGDRVIRGNSMFLNNGDGTFEDPSEEANVNPHGWFWGSVVFDYDNDGHQDIYAVNGWITGKNPDDL
ncbi:MAG: hypothetical protein ACI8UO_001338 [Verrucomicrobiales bacterium]|jgi:hypothetical protein